MIDEEFKQRRVEHYDLWPGCQAIDIIEEALTREEFIGYLKGNILKYRLRAGCKPGNAPEQELTKARHYGGLLARRLEEPAVWDTKSG